MKTTTKKRMIAIAALLLLAIGAGYLYTNNNRTANNKNGQDVADQVSSAPVSSVPGNPAEMTPAPVVTPAPAATPANDESQSSTKVKRVAASRRYYRHHSKNRQKSVPDEDDKLDFAASSNYTGNMPVAAPVNAAVSSTADAPPKPVAVQTTVQRSTRISRSNSSSRGLNFAPELGLNLNGTYHNNTNNLLTNGFHAGLMANIGLSDAFALQPSLMYTMKGNEDRATSTVEGVQVNTTHNKSLNYLELPVNLVYKFGDKVGSPRFMIGAGPYISYLFSAKDKIETTSINAEGFAIDQQNTIVNGTSGLNKLDYGVGGFLGCQLPKGFYAKASTEWGLRDVIQQSVAGTPTDRNYNYMLSVGYIIGPKNKEY